MVKYIFKPSTGARNFINKWTGDAVPTKEFFSKKLLTDKVLQELEVNVIGPKFKYSSFEDILKAEQEELEIINEIENDEEL